LGCVINNLDADFTSCLGEAAPDDPAIFGGDYDVALLSRFPLLETESKKLNAYFVRTAVLYAKLDVPGLGPLHAFCTHLGSSLGPIPYQGPYAGWDDEHGHQVTELVAYVQSKASDAAPVILLGDLNMGPALGSSVATLPEQYQQLLAVGFSDPYASQPNALCTDCADDTFNQMFPGYQDSLIDHVLLRDLPAHVATSQRVFDGKTSIAGQDGNLSDHYGVRVMLATPPGTMQP
jgi:endonuclease/exonuclease/phosphatase family metal-dependent hydrolase